MASTFTKGVLGRFGNILFSLISGYYCALKSNRDYKIYNLYCDKEQLKYLLDKVINMKLEMIRNKALSNNTVYIPLNDDSTKYEEIEYIEGKNYVNDTYMQSPKYWNNDINYIKNIINPDLEVINRIKEYYKDINFSDYICINIRRGDYKKKENVKLIGLETLEYYYNAIEKCGKDKKYLVISDDIEYCKKYFNYSNVMFSEKHISGIYEYLVGFWMGTICKGNIIANSTFGWWMAYLNYGAEMVYYPSPFFRSISSSDNIIPDNNKWVPIESKFYDMENKYKISVIVPCYNINKDSFKKTLDSIKQQSIGFNNIEIVLIDDNSTDDTYSFIREQTKEYTNIKAITLMENKGPGFARSVGIQIASGKYISFLDADDEYHENESLEMIYNKAIDNNADIACGSFLFGGILYNSFKEDKKITSYKEASWLFNLVPGLASRIYKKEFLLNNKITFLDSYIGEDGVFMAETFIKSKCTLLTNICMYNYNTNENSSLMHGFTFKKLKSELKSKVAYNNLLVKAGISPEGKTFDINYILNERMELLHKLSIEEFNEIKGDIYQIFLTEKPSTCYNDFYNAILIQEGGKAYETIQNL